MAVAAPSTLPMKLRKEESCGKAAAGFGSDARSRVLVTVTVLGSAGPLRFLVDEGETVAGLIRAALRCYAREGHMPLLGADPAEFLRYTANSRSDALKADERISFNGCRRTTGGGDSASGGEEDDPALPRARRRTTPPAVARRMTPPPLAFALLRSAWGWGVQRRLRARRGARQGARRGAVQETILEHYGSRTMGHGMI
ncbi:hypothetical protein EJB05_08731, partial [Eragrostis curvula]